MRSIDNLPPLKPTSRARKDDQRVSKILDHDDSVLSVACFKKW